MAAPARVAVFRPSNEPAPEELHHLAFAEAFARAHADDRRHWATRGRWMAWGSDGWREATEPLHDMARAIDRIVPTDERGAWFRVNHLRDALTLAAESLNRHEWDQGDTVLGLPAGAPSISRRDKRERRRRTTGSRWPQAASLRTRSR